MTSSSAHLIPFLSILLLLLQPTTFASPLKDFVCKKIGCGKGKCTPQDNTFGYSYECDQGWKQTSSLIGEIFNYDSFRPCVIPNCTLNYSCMKGSPWPNTRSVLDPCMYAVCGEGSCTKFESGKYGYQCKCLEGQTKLFNDTVFPCFSDCALGMDCANLLAVSNKSVALPTDKNDNHASSFLPAKILWMVILTLTIASSSWK